MVKKKEQELTYMQEPIPSSTKKYQTTKLNWSGLNYAQTIDTGALSMEKNISTEKAPYLTPSPKPELKYPFHCIDENTKSAFGLISSDNDAYILSVHPFDDVLIVVWYRNILNHTDSIGLSGTFISYIKGDTVHTSKMYENGKDPYDNIPRSIVQFNVNNAPLDPLANDMSKKLVIFPDKKSFDFKVEEDGFKLSNIETPTTDIEGSKVVTKYDSDSIKSKVEFNENAEEGKKPSFKVVDVGNTYINFEFVDISKYKYIGISKDIDFSASVSEPKGILFEFDNSDKCAKATVTVARLDPDAKYSIIGYGMYEDGGNYFYESIAQKGTEETEQISVYDGYVSVTTTEQEGTGAYFELNIDDADTKSYYRNTSTGEVYQYNEVDKKWRRVIIPTCPDIQYAVVHQSRVFGVGGSKVYASGFNDYTNWNLDTVDEYNESNAWCSTSQSNTKADGDFTAITTFQNGVHLFKKDIMQEVRNNKNPFRLLDVFNEGAVNNQSVRDVNGTLIFCTGEKVIAYNGGSPKVISYPLNVKKFSEPISGTDGRYYFLYCLDEESNARLFVYDTFVGQWSEREAPDYDTDAVIGFACNDNGMYMACEHSGIYKLDTNEYSGQEWCFETDNITNHTVDIKHLNKFQIYAEFEKASLKVYALYDDKETPVEIYSGENLNGMKPIRVLVRKSANYSLKLRFEGKGYMKLHSMNLITSAGGNLYE